MASYVFSDHPTILSLSETLRVGDTLTFRDNTQLVVSEDNYNSSWVTWIFGNWASAINQNTIYPFNQTSSNVFDALKVVIDFLNSRTGNNGRCQLQLHLSHYISGYSHPKTDVTVSLFRDGTSFYSKSCSVFYEDSSETQKALIDDLIYHANQFFNYSDCMKIQTTCCLEALCNPTDYILI
jgi:hypothetical protein